MYEGWYCPRCADFKTERELGPGLPFAFTVDRVSLYILQVQIKGDLKLSDAQLGLLTGVACGFLNGSLVTRLDRG